MCIRDSFDVIRKNIPDYEQRKNSLREQPEQLTSDSNENVVIDAKNNSSIVAAVMAFDIAYVEAIKNSIAKVTVLNCYDRKLIIKKVVDCAKRGVVCLAYWHDGETLHVVTSNTDDSCPEYTQYSMTALADEDYLHEKHQQTLFVVCASDIASLQQYISKNLSDLKGNQTKVISPTMMKSSYMSTLTNGIEIDPRFWQELAVLGNQVLVESTEQSRMGAGA